MKERMYYMYYIIYYILAYWVKRISLRLMLSWHFTQCVHMCQSWKCLAGPQCLSGGWLAWPITAFWRLNCAAVWSSGQGHRMWDGGPGRTKTGKRKHEMTFRTRQRGLELRIEKPNSHPCAQDFDRHSSTCYCLFFLVFADSSFYCKNRQWSWIIFHCCQMCPKTVRAVKCFFFRCKSIVQDAQIMQHIFILIASHLFP